MNRSILGVAVSILVVALEGCAASAGNDPDATIQSAIVNGTAVTTDTVGTPRFNNTVAPDTCTSTLLRDRWVITAYHCVTTDGGRWSLPAAASSLSATVGGTTAAGAEVFYSGRTGAPADVDVALVKLASSLPAPSGHPEPWDLPLFSGTSSSLVGHAYYCQGWGYSSCTNQSLGLRSANLTVSSADSSGFTLVPNASGQIQTNGDSGSSCYQLVNGRYNVLGVDSFGQCGVSATFTGAEVIRDWVDATLDRVGALDLADGSLRFKDGGLNHAWLVTYSGAFLASAAGPRIAMIRASDGHCLVKEGAFVNGWVDQGFGGVVRCLLDGSRIGVLTKDGTFQVKDGSISSSGWVTQNTLVRSAVLSGSRIGVVKSDGHFYVKDGGLSASWVDLGANVSQGALSGTRIGILTTAGDFRVKDGSVSTSGFVNQASNVRQGVLSGNRIGVVTSDGHFLVREGGLTPGGWFDEYSGVQQGILSGRRVAVVSNDGASYSFRVKEGALDASWVVEAQGSTAGYIGILPNK